MIHVCSSTLVLINTREPRKVQLTLSKHEIHICCVCHRKKVALIINFRQSLRHKRFLASWSSDKTKTRRLSFHRTPPNPKIALDCRKMCVQGSLSCVRPKMRALTSRVGGRRNEHQRTQKSASFVGGDCQTAARPKGTLILKAYGRSRKFPSKKKKRLAVSRRDWNKSKILIARSCTLNHVKKKRKHCLIFICS